MQNEEQVEIRDHREKGWFSVDNYFIDEYAREFSASAVAIYFVLCRYSDNKTKECFPEMRTIAQKVGCNKKTVVRSVAELEKFGIISIEKRRKEDGHQGSNIYTIQDSSKWSKIQSDKNDTVKSRVTFKSVQSDIFSTSRVASGVHNKTKSKKTENKKTYLRASPQKNKKTPESVMFEKEVNRVVGLFELITPTWKSFFKNGPQRESIRKLIKLVCENEKTIEEVLDKVKSLHGVMYAPQAYNPSEIFYHYPKIMAWGNEKPKQTLAVGDPYTPGKFSDIKITKTEAK